MLVESNTTYWLLHLALLFAVVYSGFDTAVISVAIIVTIFSTLGSSSSPYSAYSIFNKGCRYLLGDTRPEQIDRQIRGADGVDQRPQNGSTIMNFPSRFINRPCPCGSGMKAKKCCASVRGRDVRIDRPKRGTRAEYERNEFEGFEVIQQ
jgi:hypothetical protein